MKKDICLFLVACCLIGCKPSTDNLNDTPDISETDAKLAEQEEQALRDAPLGDEKVVRCDINFQNESIELFTKSTRKPATLRFSKNQLQKYVCNRYPRSVYTSDMFDIDCYELKRGYDSKNKPDAVVELTGFSANYTIDCPTELKRVDYNYRPLVSNAKDTSVSCSLDPMRTSEEYGYTPLSTAFYSKSRFNSDIYSEVTDWFCKNGDDSSNKLDKFKFNKYIVRCELNDNADFDELVYLKVECPNAPSDTYDETRRNVPTHANESLKCDIRPPAPKRKASDKNKVLPKPNRIASEVINTYRSGTSTDEEIEQYLKNKYCTEKFLSLHRIDKFDVECQGRDTDAYHNIITTNITKNYSITCPAITPVDFTENGSGKTTNVSCSIDPYYTAKEYSWSVHAIKSYPIKNIAFDNKTLTDAIKTNLCQNDNDRMLVGTQLNGREFVVYCNEALNETQLGESIYLKADCKDIPQKELKFHEDSAKAASNASPSSSELPTDIRIFVAEITSKTNTEPFKTTYQTNREPVQFFTEERMKDEYCKSYITKHYGNSFDMHWQETRLVNNQHEPVLGGFNKDFHVECDPNDSDSTDPIIPEQSDAVPTPTLNNAPAIELPPIAPSRNSDGFQDMANVMNKTKIQPIDYTCKLTLPNDRKAIKIISDKAFPPLKNTITESWAIDSFCSEKLQIEHKSSKFEVNCYQTTDSKPANSLPINIQFTCPPLAIIDYKNAGSGNVGFVSCKTDSTHTQKEFNWVLENDFGFAIPGDTKFSRKQLSTPVKTLLCRNPQVQHKKVVVRCELNPNPKNKTYEESIYLKINCN